MTVILSDERISSPILTKYDTAIVLNQQSMDKSESMVKPGGTLIYNLNRVLLTNRPERDQYLQNRGNRHCRKEQGNPKVFNMIVLGGFLKVKPIVKLDNVEKRFTKIFTRTSPQDDPDEHRGHPDRYEQR